MKVCQETTPQGLLKCLLVANLCNTLQQQQQQRQQHEQLGAMREWQGAQVCVREGVFVCVWVRSVR